MTDLIQHSIPADWFPHFSPTASIHGNGRIGNQRWIKYDSENRAVRVVTVDGTATDCVYDYEGTRVKKTVTPWGGSPTTTIYADLHEVTGGVGTSYILSAGKPVAVRTTAGTVTYIHTDHLDGTSLLTNNAGSVVKSFKYTSFGSTWEASGSVNENHRFTGHRSDDSTGLIYMKARYYDPAQGRFLTPDTYIQDPYNPQGLDRYAYVENNPVNNTDPTGHWKFKLMNFMAAPFIGIPAFNISHFHAPTMWNRNRDSVVNAGAAFVTGGGPIGAAAAFGATQFVQSRGGQTTIRNTATILYKNNLMGAREARIFSEFLWYTVASMSIESMAASTTGGLQSREPGVAEPDLVNNQAPHMGRQTPQLIADGGKTETLTALNGNQAVVGYGDAFKIPGASMVGMTHASASSSLTTSQTTWLDRVIDKTGARNFLYLSKGTCHQYANSNLLSWGMGSATTRTFAGYFTNAIYGNYGGQIWGKIAYSAWQSEKRW